MTIASRCELLLGYHASIGHVYSFSGYFYFCITYTTILKYQYDDLTSYPDPNGSGFIPLNSFHPDIFERILGASRNIRKTCGCVNWNNITSLIKIKPAIENIYYIIAK